VGDYKSFAVTVIGGNHKKSSLPCQDASYGEGFKDPVVSIAVVADGHGDENCFRSDRGADFAVRCAKNGMYNFVKDNNALFTKSLLSYSKKNPSPSNGEFKKIIREKLIEYIVRSWNMCVVEDFEKNPFTEEELEKVSEKYRERYKNGESITKAYGTSLIAAAITPHYWFGFHIGDGRLTALYPDGTFDQPVPWDEKCYLNVTTSICDDDILIREDGVRMHLSFHIDKPAPAAIFLCTDGVDDNYPVQGNEKHLFKLYRTIALSFAENFVLTKQQLKELADAFATKGKGDDTSIAGFVDPQRLKQAAPHWQKQIAAEEAEAEAAKKAAVEAALVEAAPVENPAEEAEPETHSALNREQGIAAYKKTLEGLSTFVKRSET